MFVDLKLFHVDLFRITPGSFSLIKCCAKAAHDGRSRMTRREGRARRANDMRVREREALLLRSFLIVLDKGLIKHLSAFGLLFSARRERQDNFGRRLYGSRQPKLPTFLREYEKVAAEAAREGPIMSASFCASPSSNSSIAKAHGRAPPRRPLSRGEGFRHVRLHCHSIAQQAARLELARCEYTVAHDNVDRIEADVNGARNLPFFTK
jgi:hypothetical protein